MGIEVKENNILIIFVDQTNMFIYTRIKYEYFNRYHVDSNKKTLSMNRGFYKSNNIIFTNMKHIIIYDKELSNMINSEDIVVTKMGLTILLENNKDLILKHVKI
jgi:hypothetical protein